MKKTVSFSLEEDIIAKIEKYRKDNDLSSKSAAVERIILKFENNNFDTDLIKNIVKQILNENSTNIKNNDINKSFNEETKKNKINKLCNSAIDSFKNMPD